MGNTYGFKVGDWVWLENIKEVAFIEDEQCLWLAQITPQTDIRFATEDEIASYQHHLN